MNTVLDIPDLKNKKVLLRVDFDVPLRRGSGQAVEITEPFKIKKQKEMIDWLVERGAKVVMVAHLHEDDSSFSDLIPQLHILLGREIGFLKNTDEISDYLAKYPGVGLLENIRKFDGEKENSRELAEKLSQGFDIYVNNDFAVSHRAHSSVLAITEFLPSFAGLLVKEEVAGLEKAINAPKDSKVVIIGGAKGESKIPVIKNLIDKVEHILLGGVVANDVLKERGRDMGSSVVVENFKELLVGLDINDSKLLVPEDFIISDNKILDIGEKTIKKYANAIGGASVVIWNGPMGLFENPSFATGTQKVAEAVANSGAFKVVGGGDTITAISKFRNIDMSKFNFVSTGGGAMLAFLAGEKLPGLEALGYYQN